MCRRWEVATARYGSLETVNSELWWQSPFQDCVMDLKLRAHGVKHLLCFQQCWRQWVPFVVKGMLGCGWKGRKQEALTCVREFIPKVGRGTTQVRALLLQFWSWQGFALDCLDFMNCGLPGRAYLAVLFSVKVSLQVNFSAFVNDCWYSVAALCPKTVFGVPIDWIICHCQSF